MRFTESMKTGLLSLLVASVALAPAAFAGTTTVNLTAQRSSTTLPDGVTVPMWRLCSTDSAGAASLGGATLTGGACSASSWTPGPTIVVPYDATGTALTINLSNQLPTPTSIVILGQIGGGLGAPNKEASPVHSPLTLSWPAAAPNPANPGDPVFTPPTQGARARSFSMEAAANGTQSYTWTALKPGTYIYETGTHPSIQAPMGLYGVLVVTSAPTTNADQTVLTPGHAYADVTYDADATLLFSEIDPKLNAAIDATAVSTAGCAPTVGACSGTIDESKYPPAVNYVPMYFLVNGRPFDPTALANNAFPVPALASTNNVLVRFANAGLRTHIPSIIGLPMAIVAEDGNRAPGKPKVQSELLLTAGKTFDTLVSPSINASTGAYLARAYPFFDRQLSLSNANQPIGGIQGILQVANGALPNAMQCAGGIDSYTVPVNSNAFNGNVITNDRGLVNLSVSGAPQHGTVTLDPISGSFTYTPSGSAIVADSFMYSGLCAATGAMVGPTTVTLSVASLGGAPTAVADTYTSAVASLLTVKVPGVLQNDSDPSHFKLSAQLDTAPAGVTVILNPDGSFTAKPDVPPTADTTYSFTYHVTNAQGTASVPTTVTMNFKAATGLQVSVVDPVDHSAVTDDYNWVIEEDQTYYHDPKNPSGAGNGTPPQSLGTNFHHSYMPLVASGCTGPRSCGDANTTIPQHNRVRPSDVVLDPSKRYYISILPGDAIDGDADAGTIGHSVGGASIMPGQKAVTVLAARNPLPAAQLSVVVFEDSGPTNGDVDEGEPGLGGFTINLFDTRGSTGDIAGQLTYDLSGMPLTNALANTIDSVTGANICPLPSPMGVVTTCPELDSQGNPSRLAGMALIKNIMPGRYDVLAIPGAERNGKGEHWVQVSTLEGTLVNDTFVKPGEPTYWQEFGPPGFHSFIGFINVDHVNAANTAQQALGDAAHATNTVKGKISSLHMDRPPSANLNDSCITGADDDAACRAALSFTTCQVAVNLNLTGQDVAYAPCDANGNFTLTNVPSGTHQLVIWDQWLDQIIAFQAFTVPVGDHQNITLGSIPVFSWFTRIEQSAYQDLNKNGVQDDGEPGIPMIPLNVRFRDGSISNYLATDLTGGGGTNELFPLFNWYVLETDTTRYKGTGVHVVYDAGGKPDTGPIVVSDLNGQFVTKDFSGVLNTTEANPLPADKQVPGALYTANTTSRIDPGYIISEGVQSFVNQTIHVEWGKTPYAVGENGGITGMVYYASTRAFDDPRLETQLSWEPGVPRVKINLYAKTVNADGTESLTLVDSTTTNSWDDNVPNMHCPGQAANDPFLTATLGTDNQFKCYDGQHVFNQAQPAPYDGRYRFPSPAYVQAATLAWLQTHPGATNIPQMSLPPGKYVVEAVLPEGYEIVKEEDKNVLNGDSWASPNTTTQFAGLGNIFILPDQATLNDSVLPGSGTAFPPCVGTLHRVPQYLSLFPESGNNAPYAGYDRPLCDRKELVLNDQQQAAADFQVFTQAPVSAHIAGMMLNDAAAEFDPAAPTWGEKAALPNAPISMRDYNGVEIARIYNDKWGIFNGLVPSTWNANVPNPSGYAPNMLTSCMNDPGPIPDPSGAIDPATGKVKMIVDPLYNPQFSNFCYVWPYMAGITTYLDTPVLPVTAFANESNFTPVDCAYPNATPAISRVDGDDVGPWISSNGSRRLTIRALGDVTVSNPAYAGPLVQDAPGNQPKITRHYGFGANPGTVTVNGVALTNVTWSDDTITAVVPPGVSTGELVITTAQGKTTIDTVTVHVGGRKPVIVKPADPNAEGFTHPIQDAINAANPGDLIIVDAGTYPELVVMDRPVQLQGVGAASVIINAAKYPNQKIADWRSRINALFGLDEQGNQTGTAVVDPLPGQTVAGVTLLEPSALGNEEGAGVTVLAKGLKADGTPLNGITGTNGDCNAASPNRLHNFLCGASLVDGLSVTGSDSGGGIYVNGWAHNLQIANNRVYGNAGQLNGGVRIGQPYLETDTLPDFQDGYGYNNNVHIHNNAIYNNGTVEGNAGAANLANTGSAGGGLSMCAGSDNYRVTSNWVCGNYSAGDGGGIGHIGHSRNGVISKNAILFNESYNQTATQNGGGLVIEGESVAGLTIGTGNVTVDANLIQGNIARAGHGGGVRLQNVNGQDASRPVGQRWRVTLTNNIISNNVAGWSGGGISLADTLYATIRENTVVSNDSVGITGNLFNTMVNGTSSGGKTTVPNPAGVSSQLTSSILLAALPAADRAAATISNPTLNNNIIWQNRSFFYDMADGTPKVLPSNQWSDAVAATKPATLPQQTATGQCVSGAAYWDLGVVGDQSPTPGGANLHLNPTYSVLTANITGYPTTGNVYSDPKLVRQYCNGSRVLPGLTYYAGALQPTYGLVAAGTMDESGNFVDLHFGPLSLTDPANGTTVNGDYHLADVTSPAYNMGTGGSNHDFDGDSRPQDLRYDIGADEFQSVSLTPDPLMFGAVQINSTSSSLTVTLKNVATTDLVLNGTGSLTITGTAASNYAVAAGTTCVDGAVIAAGATCVINVSFTPSAAGTRTATLNVNDTRGTQTVTLQGSGEAQAASVTPSPAPFGTEQVGLASGVRHVTIANTGVGPLAITSLSITGTGAADYAQTNNCPVGGSIAVGGNCVVNITFTPSAAGTRAASLSVVDGAGTQNVNLGSTGRATNARVNPTAYAFGDQTVGTASSQTVTVTNNTTTARTLVTPSFTGTGAAAYSITGNTCPGSLPAGANCTLTVQFQPGATGRFDATLNDGSPLSPNTVPFTGFGMAP